MNPIGEFAESILRDHCRALLAMEEIAPVRRRPYMTWELKEVARQYLEDEISLEEMQSRLNRPVKTINMMMRMCRDERKRRSSARVDYPRRNAKIVEALLMGDSSDSIARRWGISEYAVYQVLWKYGVETRMPREVWRRIFFANKIRFGLTGSPKPDNDTA